MTIVPQLQVKSRSESFKSSALTASLYSIEEPMRSKKTGAIEGLISDTKLKDAALQGTAFQDPDGRLSVLPLRLGREPVGSVAIRGGAISDTAMQAIGNLAAIVMERALAETAARRMEAAGQNEIHVA